MLPHLIVSAFVAGCAALLIASILWPGTLPVRGMPPHRAARIDDVLGPLLFFAIVAHTALVLIELLSRHPVRDAALAAQLLTRGAYRVWFWGGVVVGGTLAPLALLWAAALIDSVAFSIVAALLALAGLWLWEDLWVKAGQSIPLS